ncbi:KR domain-containing protein [Xylariales sp. AK1849]|nr:KR domain-containing protein [Xylariales sp. AK1849]
MVWVVADLQLPGESSMIKGMLRSIAAENVLSKYAFLELDHSDYTPRGRAAELTVHKMNKSHGSTSSEAVDRGSILRRGVFTVERLLPEDLLNDQFRLRHGFQDDIQEHAMSAHGPLMAQYQHLGSLSSLYFSRDPDFNKPLKDDWIEIKTAAIGLNMKNLAVATAKFDLDRLSTEAAGVITRLGSAVTIFEPGDRVFGMIPGNMGNCLRSPAVLVSKLPEGISADGAASMPLAYLTSIYALCHIARLAMGESVLIESATGGIGMAALRIARHLGAEIFATVGNDEKRKILVDEFGIAPNRIFNSRHLSAVDDIINSRGDSMHETWRCIAPLGRFIDIGRTDVLGGGKLGHEVFERNATFSSFDMGLVYRQKPSLIAKVRYGLLLQGLAVWAGLGSLAAWMVEQGARHLVFLSRSGTDKPEAGSIAKELAQAGAKPKIIRCDVTDKKALVSAVEQISGQQPLKGVIHATMVEGDALFNNAIWSQIQGVLAPKVTGTVNLHYATKHLPLDFFLMTSSIVGTEGTPNQGAYTAANAFQDAFARFRLSQSLPATALGLGLILEVGSVSASMGFQKMLQRNATYGVSETEFLQLLEDALCESHLSTEGSPLSKLDPGCAAQIVTGLEPARFISHLETGRANDLVCFNNTRFQAITQVISDRAEERLAIVREVITTRLAELLSLAADDIDDRKPVALYGVDNLIAGEMRNWLIKALGLELSLLQLLSKSTKIEDLVKGAVGVDALVKDRHFSLPQHHTIKLKGPAIFTDEISLTYEEQEISFLHKLEHNTWLFSEKIVRFGQFTSLA